MYYFLTQLEKTYNYIRFWIYMRIRFHRERPPYVSTVFLFLTPFYRLRVIHKRKRRFRQTHDCLQTNPYSFYPWIDRNARVCTRRDVFKNWCLRRTKSLHMVARRDRGGGNKKGLFYFRLEVQIYRLPSNRFKFYLPPWVVVYI